MIISKLYFFGSDRKSNLMFFQVRLVAVKKVRVKQYPSKILFYFKEYRIDVIESLGYWPKYE